MQVLSWNLFHGRRPEQRSHGDQLDAFAAALDSWPWDVALLQEVPPWWPRPLAERLRASMRMALTSRNQLLPLRAAIGRRWPDLIKSGGGGSNAILVRGQAITDHRVHVLTRRPERRVMHGVKLESGLWVANLHASKADEAALAETKSAVAALMEWARPAPQVVLGGDFNVTAPQHAAPLLPRMGGHWVDHVLARGLRCERAEVLEAGPLSDHRPIRVELA